MDVTGQFVSPIEILPGELFIIIPICRQGRLVMTFFTTRGLTVFRCGHMATYFRLLNEHYIKDGTLNGNIRP